MTRENGRKTQRAYFMRDNLQIHPLQEMLSRKLEFMFTRYLAIKFNHAYPRTEQLRIIKEASCYVCLT